MTSKILSNGLDLLLFSSTTFHVHISDFLLGFISECGTWDERIIAVGSLFVLFSIAMVGVEWVVKVQVSFVSLDSNEVLSHDSSPALATINGSHIYLADLF